MKASHYIKKIVYSNSILICNGNKTSRKLETETLLRNFAHSHKEMGSRMFFETPSVLETRAHLHMDEVNCIIVKSKILQCDE